MFTCEECGAKVAPDEAAEHFASHTDVGKGAVIPDIAGEIIAWRAWKVKKNEKTGEVYLHSSTKNTRWPTGGWIHAICNKNHGKSGIPGEKCTCGIYAAKTREQLMGMSYNAYNDSTTTVIGEVGLAGKVIPGTQGWRAEKGRPVRIFVPYERWEMLVALREVYKTVEFELGVTLKGK